MGQSTDALFFYGKAFEFEISHEFLDKLWENEGRFSRLGVELRTHCSSDCPMLLLAIKKSLVVAWRGSPRMLKLVQPDPKWDEKIEKAKALLLELMTEDDGDFKNEPTGWWICSDWS